MSEPINGKEQLGQGDDLPQLHATLTIEDLGKLKPGVLYRAKIIDNERVRPDSRGAEIVFKFKSVDIAREYLHTPEELADSATDPRMWMIHGEAWGEIPDFLSYEADAVTTGPIVYGLHVWLVERIIAVTVDQDTADDIVDAWHEHRYPDDLELHEALGWSWEEYKAWVERSELPDDPD